MTDNLKKTMLRRGFTLMELLVAMAIIAILGALLLPIVQQVKLKVYAFGASSNLRQIGAACLVYRGDYDHYFPVPQWASPDDLADINQDGVLEWWEKLVPYVNDLRVFRASVDMTDPKKRPSSFAANSWFDYTISESQVVDSTSCIYATQRAELFEHDFIEWWNWQGGIWPPDKEIPPIDAAAKEVAITRYAGFNNYLYVDNHVKAKVFENTWLKRVEWWPAAPNDEY